MDFPIHSITKSAQETQKIGEALGIAYLEKGSTHIPRVIVCIGELGSGKTTFVRGIARGLGITTRLLSPTYIIVRRYNIPKVSRDCFLYHLDLYRMNTDQDAESIGIADMLDDSQSITVIEWPERMSGLFLEPRIECRFNTVADNKHEVTIENIVDNTF